MRVGTVAFPLIWSTDTTAYCLRTGISPNLSRCVTRTGTTLWKLVIDGVTLLQRDREARSPSADLVVMMLRHELLIWSSSDNTIRLGPVLMVRDRSQGVAHPGSCQPMSAHLFVGAAGGGLEGRAACAGAARGAARVPGASRRFAFPSHHFRPNSIRNGRRTRSATPRSRRSLKLACAARIRPRALVSGASSCTLFVKDRYKASCSSRGCSMRAATSTRRYPPASLETPTRRGTTLRQRAVWH